MTEQERRLRRHAEWTLPLLGGALGFLVGYYSTEKAHARGFTGMAVGSLLGSTFATILLIPVREEDRREMVERERAANDALRAQMAQQIAGIVRGR